MNVAVERSASAADLIVSHNLIGAAPADEIGFDGVAVLVTADGATARVAVEVRRSVLREGRRAGREIRGGGGAGVVRPEIVPGDWVGGVRPGDGDWRLAGFFGGSGGWRLRGFGGARRNAGTGGFGGGGPESLGALFLVVLGESRASGRITDWREERRFVFTQDVAKFHFAGGRLAELHADWKWIFSWWALWWRWFRRARLRCARVCWSGGILFEGRVGGGGGFPARRASFCFRDIFLGGGDQ